MNLRVLTRAAKMNQSKGIPESGIPEQKVAICTAAGKGIKKNKCRAVENLDNFYGIPFPSLLKVFYLYFELPSGQENTNGFAAWRLKFLGNGVKSTQFQQLEKFLCGPNRISQACFHIG